METGKKWADLTWQDKREARFQKWLSPDIKFVNAEAEKLYKARVTRFIKAIKMEDVPDRVPVMLPQGTTPAYYVGADFRTIMYDYKIMRDAWIKFMDDFGDMDFFNGPILIPSGKVADALDSRVQLHPGHGLPLDASMNQTLESEYMYADEYDLFMMDPSDYNIRVMSPRTTGLFESFKKLPPLRYLQGTAWVTALADPDIRKTFQTLMDLADEYKEWKRITEETCNYVLSRGYPSFRGGIMAGAPFDHFADLYRGTRGIAMDLRRQPEKLHEAMEHWLEITVKTTVKNFPMTECPVCIMPLHKGDDTFMSDKQFAEFYWPYLRRLFLAMIEEGLVPMPFAEGRYNNRLKQITDTPRGSVIWYFDQTDMAEAKKVLGNISCIAGNVPTSLLMTSSPQQVKDYCHRLIDVCAPGGGYILTSGASIDKGNIANLKAMMEAAYEFGVYH